MNGAIQVFIILTCYAFAYGFYSLTLPVAKYTLVFRYIGDNDIYISTDSIKAGMSNIKLVPASVELKDM